MPVSGDKTYQQRFESMMPNHLAFLRLRGEVWDEIDRAVGDRDRFCQLKMFDAGIENFQRGLVVFVRDKSELFIGPEWSTDTVDGFIEKHVK